MTATACRVPGDDPLASVLNDETNRRQLVEDDYIRGYELAHAEFADERGGDAPFENPFENPFDVDTQARRGYEDAVYDLTQK